ncbi:sigma-70 family RNA polymerase sigma factor [Asanoa sp. NPDC049518]|uniref:sigma-70 family RNA polymerase sigma factor n=1 Tax=unclassified Asanoa TaxID=2685164 RepID=UPI0034394C3B
MTQTTLVSMYEVWGRIRNIANLEAYSRRVLMNAVFDQRKRRSAGEVVLTDLPESPPPPHGDSAETHVVLLRALATLPVRDQAIVVLRHWEDLSVETVAGILDVSVSVVKTQNGRPLGRLRAALGEDFART